MESFDLGKAIAEWKRDLFKTPGLDESHIAELEAGLRDEIEELVSSGMDEREAFVRAASEKAAADVLGEEFHKARARGVSGRPPWRAPRPMPALLWHNLKTGFRKIRRQKSYTVINVAGLAAGMACFLLILTAVRFEMSYDRFHEKSGKVFRLALRNQDPSIREYSTSTPEILSGTMTSRVPEVRQTGLILRSRNAVLQTETTGYAENGLFADERFFSLFSFELLLGHPEDVLKAPRSIVLAEDLAVKMFGFANPVGRSLRYKGRFLDCELNVAGIMRRPPLNSHLQFGYLISVASLAADEEASSWFQDWDTAVFTTYVELSDARSRIVAEQKIAGLLREARPQINMREDAVFLQPIEDIHLKSWVEGASATNNRIQSVYLYGAIALLVLLIAGVNSMNLSTALASTRAKEIGIRKVIGALRPQLVRQFLGESYLLTTLAMGLSLALFLALFPAFSRFLGNGLTLKTIDKLPLALSILGTILFVGAFSGLYPAFVLSAQRPFAILKKSVGAKSRKNGIRNLLVVFQFSAVGALLIGTIVVTRQLNFIKTKSMGYEREHVVVVPLKDAETVRMADVLKSQFLACPDILSVTIADSTPLRIGSSVGGSSVQKDGGETVKINYSMADIDADFLKVYGMEIGQGRGFSADNPSDSRSVLVNEAFVRRIGWKKPLDMRLHDSPVIGVVKDFHFDTLQKEIEPLALSLKKPSFSGVNIGVRLRPGDPGKALAAIREVFTRTAVRQPFDFYFLEDAFDQLYRNERGLALFVAAFVALAVILGCMGLFGLASHAIKRRVKEIGIRKVLGAPVGSLVRLISREFIVLVAVANAMAWPIGYYILSRWLRGYAYRCSLGIDVFLVTGLATLGIAMLAVGVHTVKAAWSNPVESIRYE